MDSQRIPITPKQSLINAVLVSRSLPVVLLPPGHVLECRPPCCLPIARQSDRNKPSLAPRGENERQLMRSKLANNRNLISSACQKFVLCHCHLSYLHCYLPRALLCWKAWTLKKSTCTKLSMRNIPLLINFPVVI
jgi:hypothetical protein